MREILRAQYWKQGLAPFGDLTVEDINDLSKIVKQVFGIEVEDLFSTDTEMNDELASFLNKTIPDIFEEYRLPQFVNWMKSVGAKKVGTFQFQDVYQAELYGVKVIIAYEDGIIWLGASGNDLW